MEKYRAQLNDIDLEMRQLFEKRLDVVAEIAKYKHHNNIPVLDQKREDDILKKGVSLLSNKNYSEYYTSFIKLQLQMSRDLQTTIIKSLEK